VLERKKTEYLSKISRILFCAPMRISEAINAYRMTKYALPYSLLTKYFRGYRYFALYEQRYLYCASCTRNISCPCIYPARAQKYRPESSSRKTSTTYGSCDRLPIAVSQITSTREVHRNLREVVCSL